MGIFGNSSVRQRSARSSPPRRRTNLREILSADWLTDRCVASVVGRHDNDMLQLNLISVETHVHAYRALHPRDHCTSFLVTAA